MSEAVEGDYLEFGVFKGASFSDAIACFTYYENIFIANWASRNLGAYGAGVTVNQEDSRQKLRSELVRFFAFDSFEGLPKLEDSDADHHIWRRGRFALAEDEFMANVIYRAPESKQRTEVVKGFFSKSLTDGLRSERGLKKASVIMIDSDLYSSCVDVLRFIEPLLQSGSIIIFDDWNCFRASNNHGERRAVSEWLSLNSLISLEPFAQTGPYQRAFITHILPSSN